MYYILAYYKEHYLYIVVADLITVVIINGCHNTIV